MADLDVAKFLEDLSGRYARVYDKVIGEMLVAKATGNRVRLSTAREKMGEVFTETMGTAEILGATIALRLAGAAPQEQFTRYADGSTVLISATPIALLTFAKEPIQTILPRVTFEEAVQDMIDRTPVTIRRAAERSAARISQLYGEGRVVAFVRSAEAAVTKRVQSLIVEAIKEGITEGDLGARIVKNVDFIRKRTGAWTEAYARMAFRTNVSTAITAGQFRQAQDQDIRDVLPAFMFDDAGDTDVRPNHHAANKRIFKVDNVVWNRIAPPLGYS